MTERERIEGPKQRHGAPRTIGRTSAAWAWRRAAWVGLLGGCVQVGTFPCEQDSQCVLDGREGICAAAGFCALPDDGCESGYRYHARGVPEDLAGQCAPLSAGESTSGSVSTGEGSSHGAITIDGDTASSGTASSSEGGSSTTGVELCGDHPCPCTLDLAVGANHTCVVRTDGDVTCWGANNQAQMGSGNASGPVQGLIPVELPSEAVAEAIHSGGEHVCALAQGALWCWGRNNQNQIDPAGTDVLPPQAMPVFAPPGAVGLGLEHSCVGEPGGTGLQCLGNNLNDELGGGGGQPVDSAIPGMQAIDELALGDDHGCARASGRVWCWGSDQYGQLGQNMVAGPTPMKTEVSLPSDATLLVAGSEHSCVALNGGMAVRCWGRNDDGQLGDGTTTNRQLPTSIAGPPPSPVVAMDSAVDTTCALLTDGDLWCWGGLNAADLGLDIAANTPLTIPQRVPGIDALPEPVAGFGVGSRHLCVHASSGRLWCWGRNNAWQVGPIEGLQIDEPYELDLDCPPP